MLEEDARDMIVFKSVFDTLHHIMDEKPTIIRLLDASGTVIDSVTASYEDSFCLEELGDLVAAHSKLQVVAKNKEGLEEPVEPFRQRCFIIARVQTWDHKQPGRAFYSYYNAFHLNKILFQTQVYLRKKLIHRIHVLNPLTNTDIIGHVQYFIVRGKTPPLLAGLETNQPQAALITRTAIIDQTNSGQFSPLKVKIRPASALHQQTDIVSPQTWTHNTQLVSEIVDESKTVKNANTNSAATIITNAARLMSASAVSIGRKVSRLSPARRSPSPLADPQRVGDSENALIKVQGRSYSLGRMKSSLKESGELPRRHTVSTHIIAPPSVTIKTPEGPLHINSHRKAQCKVAIPAGKVTQFTVPVPESQLATVSPLTPPRRRRHLSMRNSCAAPGNFSEWVSTIRNATLEESVPIVITYDAVFLGSDSDFLESSKIRAIFKENALNPEDTKLFEMPEFTGDSEVPVVVFDENEQRSWGFGNQNSGLSLRSCYSVRYLLLTLMVFILIIVFSYLALSRITSPASSPRYINISSING